MARRFSGLQADVFSLYRQLWRAARINRDEASRVRVQKMIRQGFEKHRDLKRIEAVEYYLRYGHKQLKLLKESAPSNVGEMKVPR
eukprot:m.60821 g.60821  ORF g.60821 m.60821 type:complete len:85 (-) comp7304_c0_seq2:174-428(-)